MCALLLDTHAVIWLLEGSQRLSRAALDAIEGTVREGSSLHVSAISIVEMGYLAEKGKIPEAAYDRLMAVLDAPGAMVSVPVTSAIARAIRQVSKGAIPDMPDRIIAATAMVLDVPLVTRDERIRAAGIQVVW